MCHGPKKKKAGLVLHIYTDEKSILKDRKKWHEVVRMVHSGEMPEAKRPYVFTKCSLPWDAKGTVFHSLQAASIRKEVEGSLRRLKLDRIDLFQLHRIDAKVSLEDQIGVLVAMQNEGKIRHIGLSEVSIEQIQAVQRLTAIATVQNLYNLVERRSEDVLNYCARESIGFIPWFPLATGTLAKAGSPLASAANRLGASPSQIALAWLLKKSPVILPIPGTSKVDHLESNAKAALFHLDDNLMAQFNRLTS